MIAPIIANCIKADTEICGLLGVFKGEAAIFTIGLPKNCAFPAVLIRDVTGGSFGTREDTGGEAQLDVQVFDDKELSSKEVRDIAKMLRKLLNRNDLEPYMTNAGLISYGCVADLPANTNDDLGFPGYTVRVNVRFLDAD